MFQGEVNKAMGDIGSVGEAVSRKPSLSKKYAQAQKRSKESLTVARKQKQATQKKRNWYKDRYNAMKKRAKEVKPNG